MKYQIILNNDEIEKILSMKFRNLKEVTQKLEEDFCSKQTEKYKFIFEIATSVQGKIENNPPNLKCPNCNGKYVVRTYAGDLYYRLLNGSKSQKEQEKKKFAKMGLYSNPWATHSDCTRDYWCLNCGIRWDEANKRITGWNEK